MSVLTPPTTSVEALTEPELPATALRRARWWGIVGTSLLAVGALGAGVLPRPDPLVEAPVLRLLREGAGVSISIAIAALGMAVWVAAWWSLRARLHGDLGARWIGVTAAWWSLPLALVPPLFSRDVYSYAAQGQLVAHGINPYEHGPAELMSSWATSTSPVWYFSPAPYGPLFMIVARGAAMLGEATGRVEAAVLALRLVSICAVALLAVYLPRLAQHCGIDTGRAQWLAVGCPLLLVYSVAGIHNDAGMMALAVAALVYAAERRPLLAGLLLGAAVAIKASVLVVLPFAVLLPVALAHRNARLRGPAIAAAATVGAAAASLVALTFAAGLGWGWVGALLKPGNSLHWTSLPTSWGIAATWLNHPFVEPSPQNPTVELARTIGTGVLGLTLIAIWSHTAWRLRPRHVVDDDKKPTPTESSMAADFRHVVQACGLALVAVNFLSPVFHPWYFLWPLTLLSASILNATGRRVTATAAAALCFLVLPDGYNLARCTLTVGVPVVVIATLAAAGMGVAMAIRSRQYTNQNVSS